MRLEGVMGGTHCLLMISMEPPTRIVPWADSEFIDSSLGSGRSHRVWSPSI